MPNRVLSIIAALLGGLALQGCAVHPQYEIATPQVVRQGTEVSRTQVEEAATVVCPANTRRREFVEYETRVQSGRGGQPSAVVRVQCIPDGMRPEEIPPVARPANPLPVPQHAPNYGGGRGIPYSRHYDTGYRPPGHFWPGGGARPSRYPPPGYAPNGYPPVWDASTRTWWCRNFFGNRYECLFQ